MSRRLRIAYLLTRELARDPILQSQVRPAMLALSSRGHRLSVLGPGTSPGEDLSGRVGFIPAGGGPLPQRLARLAVGLRKLVRNREVDVLYARDIWAGTVAAHFGKGLPLIYDLRGLVAEEAALKGRSVFKHGTLKFLERRVLKWATRVISVTHALARAADASAAKVTVIPCAVDPSRFPKQFLDGREAVRLELALDDRFVVAYSGGAAVWQGIDLMVEVMKRLFRSAPQVHWLIVSQDRTAFERAVRAHGLDEGRVTLLSTTSAGVPRLLSAADLGLLLRDDNLVNRTASPIKFGEYLMSGVPVAVSSAVEDCAAFARTHQVGVSLSGSPDEMASAIRRYLSSVTEARAAVARRCREAAEAEWSWAGLSERLESVFHQAAGGAGE